MAIGNMTAVVLLLCLEFEALETPLKSEDYPLPTSYITYYSGFLMFEAMVH